MAAFISGSGAMISGASGAFVVIPCEQENSTCTAASPRIPTASGCYRRGISFIPGSERIFAQRFFYADAESLASKKSGNDDRMRMSVNTNNAFVTTRPYTVVLVIPSGSGAYTFSGGGGYAGDALPVVRAFARAADRVITHPNSVSGSVLYWPMDNVMTVEGYGLDKFSAGEWGLRPVHQNRIGVVIDQGVEPELRFRQLQAADAARATLGVDVAGYVVTDSPLHIEADPSGDTLDPSTPLGVPKWGAIGNPGSLLRATEYLIKQARVQAIACVSRFPDDIESESLEAYHRGRGVNPLAGAEALISNLVVKTFRVPCSHAPAIQPGPMDAYVNRRRRRRDNRRSGRGESAIDDRLDSLDDLDVYMNTHSRRGNRFPYGLGQDDISYSFLPSVLAQLSRAPQMIDPSMSATDYVAPRIRKSRTDNVDPFEYTTEYERSGSASPPILGVAKQRRTIMDNIEPAEYLAHAINRTGDVYNSSVDAVIVPAGSFGGTGVINFSMDPRIKIVAVEDHRDYDRDLVAGAATDWSMERMGVRVERARNYMEALGMIIAHRAGIASQSLHPSLGRIPDLGYINSSMVGAEVDV
eukprot:CAMPEP_0184331060 /NCGR_PEP_ID=MMETSP1089-20130417/339_1 /TAXON_ID=38269 ORGANISM="Gloeochaete wittrockiana, Strain SAG46.84" /NCGR_SAMPLE_ID=MMETSP1089 /ASSEMBLY_ACC=CAM_ASM_000445 /LENGTH=583 /DNA_ID=CAMNT_0026653683 /DNA_START=112 /DNA_END=1863 /DNA_ORIENTATION=-